MGQRGQRQLASAVSHAENRGGRALGSTFAPRGVWVWRVRQCVVIEQHAPSRLKFAICSADRGPMAATVSLAVLIVVSYPASIRPSCSVPVLVRPYELSRPAGRAPKRSIKLTSFTRPQNCKYHKFPPCQPPRGVLRPGLVEVAARQAVSCGRCGCWSC